MLAPGYRLLPPLSTAGGPSLPGDPFRLGAPHQACMENPLPELHPHGYRRPYFLGPTGTQRLREYDVGKDEGSLGVQLHSITPCHSTARRAVNQRPTTHVGLAYQISD